MFTCCSSALPSLHTSYVPTLFLRFVNIRAVPSHSLRSPQVLFHCSPLFHISAVPSHSPRFTRVLFHRSPFASYKCCSISRPPLHTNAVPSHSLRFTLGAVPSLSHRCTQVLSRRPPSAQQFSISSVPSLILRFMQVLFHRPPSASHTFCFITLHPLYARAIPSLSLRFMQVIFYHIPSATHKCCSIAIPPLSASVVSSPPPLYTRFIKFVLSHRSSKADDYNDFRAVIFISPVCTFWTARG